MTATSGYSGTPLSRKLGIKPGTRLRTVAAPADYQTWLAPLPEGARVSSRLRNPVDIWHVFVRRRRQLVAALERALADLPDHGAIWVSWPKKSSALASDINEDEIRRAALPRGLVDIKVCAVDATWSALKLVIRREHRRSAGDPAIDLREPRAADYPEILRLNRTAERETSPLDRGGLINLLADCRLRLLAVLEQRVAGFLLALPSGQRYASPNYRWFDQRYDDFLYIDRIVVDSRFRGRGVARHLYRQLFDFARRESFAEVLAEINIEPPNPASLSLHRKLGFVEVGQLAHGASKQVSMQRLQLD